MFWNSVATSIIIISKKVEDKEIFIKQPYQSDYVSLWKSENKSNNIKVELPLIFSKINRLYKYYFIKYDKRYFQKVK